MELILHGNKGFTDYMFNFFAHPDMLDFYSFCQKIHVSISPYNGFTATKTHTGQINYVANQKVVVLTRIPNVLIRYFWKTAKSVKFNVKKLEIDQGTLGMALIDHPNITESILKEDNTQMRRDFIAVLKILSTPVDFPILINGLLVKKPVAGAVSVFENTEGFIKLPIENI